MIYNLYFACVRASNGAFYVPLEILMVHFMYY